MWPVLSLLLLAAACGGLGFVLGRRQHGGAPTAEPIRGSTAPTDSLDMPRIENVFHPASSEDERRRNAIYAKVFNLVPDTLTITRISDGRFVEVNHNWEELTGFTREEGVGHTSAELGVWVEPEQRATLIATLKSGASVRDFDVTFKHKKGHLYYNKVSASIFEAEGEAYMMLAVKDVSAKRAADLQLRELNQTLETRVHQRTQKLALANEELGTALERLQRAQEELVRSEKLAALGALVAGVAHELNTPLGNGLMAATTLDDRLHELEQKLDAGLRRSDLDHYIRDARSAHQLIVRNMGRAAELVRSFKQVAIDRTSSQRRRFRLRDVVEETLLTLSQAIGRSGHTLVKNIEDDLMLESYPGPLGQVLDNLINNTLVHAFEPGQTGRIELTAKAGAPGEVHFIVRDNGSGIADAHLSRVFDPFFTTRLGQGGSGLGLNIVHNLVTGLLGGRIDVSNADGGGARFDVTLPLEAPRAGEELSA